MKRSAKPRPPQHLVLDLKRWSELYEKCVEDERRCCEAAEAAMGDPSSSDKMNHWRVASHKLDALNSVLEMEPLLCTVERITPASTPAKPGAPRKRSDEMVLQVWLSIEDERLEAGADDVKPFIDSYFKSHKFLPVVDLSEFADERERMKIEDAGTARRRYVLAEKMMRDNPLLAEHWRTLAQMRKRERK